MTLSTKSSFESTPICGHCRLFLNFNVKGVYFCLQRYYSGYPFPPFFNTDKKDETRRSPSSKACRNADLLDINELKSVLQSKGFKWRKHYYQRPEVKAKKKLYWKRPYVLEKQRIKQKLYRIKLKQQNAIGENNDN